MQRTEDEDEKRENNQLDPGWKDKKLEKQGEIS